MKFNIWHVAGFFYIASWVGVGIASVGKEDYYGNKMDWTLPVVIFFFTAIPFMLGILAEIW